MIDDSIIKQQLQFLLKKTNFDFLGEKYEGKVRDNYLSGNTRYLITTDRLSCFDVVVTNIPFKGQTLNQMAVKWFDLTKDIIANHIIDIPDPNVMVVKNCEILPIEVVVRDYITGGAWRDYEAGKSISGITLPKGLKSSQKLPETYITPSTKAQKGEHDMPISEADIISGGIVEEKLWMEVREKALELFKFGREYVAKQGLILVDTKYEFGILDGKLILADEIHTMDSSRYWIAESYMDKFNAGQSPVMLDKEVTRQWLLSKGYKGNGEIPEFTDNHRVEMARHYINSYEKITGDTFEAKLGSVADRIKNNLLCIRSRR